MKGILQSLLVVVQPFAEFRQAGRLVWLALLIVGVTGPVVAQNTNSGDIRGTVTDASGAVIPGVSITALNTQTGVTKQLTTNSAGIYDAVSITPGTYTLTFSKAGFQTFVRSGILLGVETTTVNARLSIGATTQQVVVNGEGTVLQTDTSAIESTLDHKAIEQLPQVGSDWLNFTKTLPGVQGSGEAIAVNGNMPNEDSFLSDGGTITLPESNNVSTGILETIAEVKIDTSNFGAEYATGGAVFNQITKNGTNTFHGAAYEYFQNNFLNAASYFNPQVANLRYDNYGGAIGGPILRDKLFFYFDYDRIHNTSNSYPFYTYPTAAMKAGDFSNPAFPAIYDPSTYNPVTGVRTQFPGNKIPVTSFDPVAANILAYFPTPNLPGLVNNFQTALTTVSPYVRYFGRLDYNVSKSNELFGSVLEGNNTYNVPTPDCPLDCSTGDTDLNTTQITDVWTLSPTVVNRFQFAYLRQGNWYTPGTLNKGYPQKIGLDYAKANVFPNVTINADTAFPGTSLGGGLSAIQVQNTFQPSDVLTLIRGKHILKFGGEYLDIENDLTQWGNVQAANLYFAGYYSQDMPFTSDGSGSGYADFLLGQVNSWSATNSPEVGLRNRSFATFAEDDVKVLPNLTVNLGVRDEMTWGWWEEHNRMGIMDPTLLNPATGTLGAMRYAGKNGPTDLQAPVNSFLPRVGFSWQPKPNWAVRGGFGMYTYFWSIDVYGVDAAGFGNQSSGGLQDSTEVSPVFPLSDPNPPLNYTTVTSANSAPDSYNGQSVPYYPHHTPVPKVYEYSLSLQRQLGPGTVVQAAYVGSHGTHLSFPVSINQVPQNLLGTNPNPQLSRPFPQFLTIYGDQFHASANYNSLQLSLNRRYRNGLSADINYTWSKMMDDGDSAGQGGVAGAQTYQNAYNLSANYGPSNFDLTNNFKAAIVYELPVGRGKRLLNYGGLLNVLLGGWQASGIYVQQSGKPYTPVIGTANLTGAIDGDWYPNVVGDPHLSNRTLLNWFNANAYAQPAPFTFGDAGRNSLRGPGLAELDASAAKNFAFNAISHAVNLQVRIDATNALNHPSFGNPPATIGVGPAVATPGNFGPASITSTTVGGRNVQLGARLSF